MSIKEETVLSVEELRRLLPEFLDRLRNGKNTDATSDWVLTRARTIAAAAQSIQARLCEARAEAREAAGLPRQIRQAISNHFRPSYRRPPRCITRKRP